MTFKNTYKYNGKIYQPYFIDSLGNNSHNLDYYDSEEFDKLLVLKSEKNGLDIALNINTVSKKLKISEIEINKYLLWLYKRGLIVLYSNGYKNNFYEKEKNKDKNIKNIYLIRLKKDFIRKTKEILTNG